MPKKQTRPNTTMIANLPQPAKTATRTLRIYRPIRTLLITTLATTLLATAPDAAQTNNSERISVFSGLTVPRFANLKFNRINGRSGPGLQYPVIWTYNRTGLPVIVVRESPNWRKIRDPDGDETWVHKRMLTKANNALVIQQTLIHTSADTSATTIAIVDTGVILNILECQQNWCKTQNGRHRGWVPQNNLWGVPNPEQQN